MFSISVFHQLLKTLPREIFDKSVRKRNADKYSKGFGHWDHLVAMMYGQLAESPSLRVLENGFNQHHTHHYHLGTHKIRRTTLADANAKRSDAVFNDVAQWLMAQLPRKLRSGAKELTYLLDSTSLTLKGREFDRWTLANRTRNTQGMKVHVLLAADTKAPEWCEFSPANVNDVEIGRDVPIESDALYVFDKGYCDYRWWHTIDEAGARFVTRFKRNAGLEVIEELPVPDAVANVILKDEVVRLKHRRQGGKVNPYIKPLRCITVARADKPTPLVLATNDMKSSATAIAAQYKGRWEIELFFKWIKQHLKIKSFLGRSENAVRIQVLTALITYLLVALYKATHAAAKSLWECLATVRAALFQRPDTEESVYRRRRQELADFEANQGRLIP